MPSNRFRPRRLLIGIPWMVCMGLAAGCDDRAGSATTRPAGSAKLLKIAVIPKATNHEYWKAVHAGALKAAAELDGVQIIWKGPPREDDRNDQIGVVENFIDAGAAGIVLAPLDDTALLRPVRHAMQAGIPVVIIDSGLKAAPGADYVSYVATDNEAGGRRAARRMGEVLGGKGNVLVLRYQQGSASTTQREEGFLDELTGKFPDIRIVSSDQHAGVTTEEAFDKAQNLLEKHPDLDGVFGPCEPVIAGVLRALHEAGRAGRVKVIGFDRSEKLVAAMKAGQVHGLVLQDPINIGYLGVKTLAAHLRGERVPERIDTGSRVATLENMNEPAIAELLSPPVEKYLK
ncbi:MAG: D-ribose ABC transporter substrate-binding protein [Phycisphaerae bacterium]